MADMFQTFVDSPLSPARLAFPITPHDITELQTVPRGIYVGTGGNVTLRSAGASTDVTYKNLADGSYIAVRATHVREAGTTAADLIGEA